MAKVKTVDVQAPNAAQEIAESLRETGFVVLSNTEISPRSIQHVYGDWAEFFSSSDKTTHLHDTKIQSGYFPFKSETAKGSDLKDLKEFFHVFRDTHVPEPACDETKLLFEDLLELGLRVLGMIETQLPDSVHDALSMPLMSMMASTSAGENRTLLRILHYPPIEPSDEGIRSAAHEDINLITLLPAATETGLQVKDNDGVWHDIVTNSGEIVVNVGDMLQEATGGYFKSTSHRVVNPTGEDAKKSRYSAPLFIHPTSDVKLSDRYTAGQYLEERLQEIGLKKKSEETE